MSGLELKLPTKVEEIVVDGGRYFLKRDDQIHPHFSGNKGRKFMTLLETDSGEIDMIVSRGSNQSNAMYSLSVLARAKGWRFVYITDHISSYLAENPAGNYARALKNGTEFVIGDADIDSIMEGKRAVFIEEGGRCPLSEAGIATLAAEIERWREEAAVERLDIFLPSGTGTTALYLQKSLLSLAGESCRVYTTPCVGDGAYLLSQFRMLEKDETLYPRILDPDRKYHFGRLYREFYEIWLKLRRECGVEFDMLYDPKGWMTLLAHRCRLCEDLLYIHQGGLVGNETMLPRYERKFGVGI